MIALWNTL